VARLTVLPAEPAWAWRLAEASKKMSTALAETLPTEQAVAAR